MPKIFLIKNRLHQQQLRLLESQNLLGAKDDDRLGPLSPGHPHSHRSGSFQAAADAGSDEPLSLVARNRDTRRDSGKMITYILYIITRILPKLMTRYYER